MKKLLRISIEFTIVTVVLCYLSDVTVNTKYLGSTYFQPFPHLILLTCFACDLLFLYQSRTQKRIHCVPPKKKALIDYVILWTLFCLIMAIIGLTIDYFFHFK